MPELHVAKQFSFTDPTRPNGELVRYGPGIHKISDVVATAMEGPEGEPGGHWFVKHHATVRDDGYAAGAAAASSDELETARARISELEAENAALREAAATMTAEKGAAKATWGAKPKA